MKPVTNWLIFGTGLIASVALTYRFGGLYIFFVLPFFYFPLRGTGAKICSQCGRETMHPGEVYCALDGTKLERK